MFKVTIEGSNMGELGMAIAALASQFSAVASYAADDAAREELQAKRTAAKSKAKPTPENTVEEPIENDDVDAELLAPVAKAPPGASVTVDAGTGQVAGKAEPADDQPIKMTMDDVKAAAAKLAAANTPKLKALLNQYGAAKLSDVPPAKLGSFAADVLEALGE